MGRSAMLIGFVGVILGTSWAQVVYEKSLAFNQGNDFIVAGFSGDGIFQGLRRLHQGADVNKGLLRTAYLGEAGKVVQFLQAGANPNYVGENGRFTPLIVAASENKVEVIRILLNAGAKVGYRNSHGATALEYAAINGATEAVKVLLAAGADPNQRDDEGYNPIHRATFAGHGNIVQELVSWGGDINLRSSEPAPGDTPLHIAARVNRVKMVEVLLSLGADVHAENAKHKHTPLHSAAMENAWDSMLILIKAGANVNHADGNGDTALFIAAFWGNQISIEVLLDNGAARSQAGEGGLIPKDALCQCTFAESISELCQVEACETSSETMLNLLNP